MFQLVAKCFKEPCSTGGLFENQVSWQGRACSHIKTKLMARGPRPSRPEARARRSPRRPPRSRRRNLQARNASRRSAVFQADQACRSLCPFCCVLFVCFFDLMGNPHMFRHITVSRFESRQAWLPCSLVHLPAHANLRAHSFFF